MSDQIPPGRDHCPTCGADGPTQTCATASGRDHAARHQWRTAYDTGVAAGRDRQKADALADERRWDSRAADRRTRDLPPATEKFAAWTPFLSLGGWGIGNRAFERVKAAMWDVREYRRLSGTRGWDYESETMVVRIAADTFAGDIAAAVTDEQDPPTIAWVLAGLRCTDSPFCAGCSRCFTIAAPLRPTETRARGGFR